MSIENFPKDPVILLSFMNMKLRDTYASKAAMVDDLERQEEDWNMLAKKLAVIDYHYDAAANQFK